MRFNNIIAIFVGADLSALGTCNDVRIMLLITIIGPY
jgi:hypothetical protein